MAAAPRGYSTVQIALHWLVALLILAQYLIHDGMEEAWRSFMRAEPVPADVSAGANLHAATGIAILVLALARLWLRWTRGVPPLPAEDPRVLRIFAHGTHYAIYALIIMLPLAGGAAWFLGARPAGSAHAFGAAVLFWLVLLHIAGALFQNIILRANVIQRMFYPRD